MLFSPFYSIVQKAEGFSVIQKHPSTSHGRSRSPGYFFSMVSLFSPPRLTNTTLVTSGKKKKKKHRRKEKRETKTDRKTAWGKSFCFWHLGHMPYFTLDCCVCVWLRHVPGKERMSLCLCFVIPAPVPGTREWCIIVCSTPTLRVLKHGRECICASCVALCWHGLCCPSNVRSPECFHTVSCQVEPAAGAISR